MMNIKAICIALLASAALVASALSASAHTLKTDSREPVVLGAPFQFPANAHGVTRPVCASPKHIARILTDISRLNDTHALHLLFHISEKKLDSKGDSRLKGGLSAGIKKMLERECQDIRSTEFAPVEVIDTVNVGEDVVHVVTIYESYRDQKGVSYTWFVNTNFTTPEWSHGMQVADGKVEIGVSVDVPKDFFLTSDRSLVEKILSSAEYQPAPVGRRVLLSPLDSHMEHETRAYLEERGRQGRVHALNESARITFDEVLGTRTVLGLPVLFVAFDVGEIRFYTWLVTQ